MSESPSAGSGSAEEWVLTADRQLHLLDQVIGLRARLAEETVRGQMRLAAANAEHEAALALLHTTRLADAGLRAELEAAHRQLAELRASRTWRMGRLVTAPPAALRRLARGRRAK